MKIFIIRGEVENKLRKIQRNQTVQHIQRVRIGCRQDAIFEIDINAITFEIGFLEVVGNAIVVDLSKRKDDLISTRGHTLPRLIFMQDIKILKAMYVFTN